MKTAAVLLLVFGNAALAAEPACPLRGEPVQWMADYCMAAGETDDIESVAPCIEQSLALHFKNACAAKRHFKQKLCETLLPYSTRHGSVAQCMKDPDFSGNTVKNNGSGG
jgi:hypothetical protein